MVKRIRCASLLQIFSIVRNFVREISGNVSSKPHLNEKFYNIEFWLFYVYIN